MKITLAVAAITCACAPLLAQAQSKNLGSYAGTIDVSGTQHGPEVTYRARAKISLPVSERDASSVTAEFLSGEAPNATVLISQWEISHREKHADSGGQFSSYTCSLAAPTEVPMTPSGVINVDLKAKKYGMSITLVSTKELAFNCKHSRSGPYKKKQGVGFTLGTGTPGMQMENPQPFSNPDLLAAKYTLTPAGAAKGEYGPIVQEWDLKLAR